MNALIAVTLTLVAFSATTVVLTDDPVPQAITVSVFGLLITLLFFVLQAPDVALSEVGVGAAVIPLIVMLTIRKIGGGR